MDQNETVPPPIHGERLSRIEFERRYEAHPEIFRAELLAGTVFVHPPGRPLHLGCGSADMIGWVGYYQSHTSYCDAGVRVSMRMGIDSEVQPDVYLGIYDECGGRLNGPEADYMPQPPEMLVEAVDRGTHPTLSVKLCEYAKAGVCEVIVLQTLDRRLDWFALHHGEYMPLPIEQNGIIRSELFPGLWLDVGAKVRRDGARVLAVLQEGLQSLEHARFVAELTTRRTS